MPLSYLILAIELEISTIAESELLSVRFRGALMVHRALAPKKLLAVTGTRHGLQARPKARRSQVPIYTTNR